MKTYRIINGKFCVICTASPLPTIKAYEPDEMVRPGLTAGMAALAIAARDEVAPYPHRDISVGQALWFAGQGNMSPEGSAQYRAAVDITALDRRIKVLREIWDELERAAPKSDPDEDEDDSVDPVPPPEFTAIDRMLRECRDRRAALIAPYNAVIAKAVAAFGRTIELIGA